MKKAIKAVFGQKRKIIDSSPVSFLPKFKDFLSKSELVLSCRIWPTTNLAGIVISVKIFGNR